MSRIERQIYANNAAIIAETVLVNEESDMVRSKAEKATFNWDAASTATHDGIYILQETRTTGAGRWHRELTATAILNGNLNSAAIPNGNTVRVDIAVVGALTSVFNDVKVMNEAALNTAGIDVIGRTVIANDVVRVTLFNPTGNDIAAQNVVVKLVQF
jgi:hypothetical protein